MVVPLQKTKKIDKVNIKEPEGFPLTKFSKQILNAEHYIILTCQNTLCFDKI